MSFEVKYKTLCHVVNTAGIFGALIMKVRYLEFIRIEANSISLNTLLRTYVTFVSTKENALYNQKML
jgi:hypothetical protein